MRCIRAFMHSKQCELCKHLLWLRVGMVAIAYNYVIYMDASTVGQPQPSTLSSSTVRWLDPDRQ